MLLFKVTSFAQEDSSGEKRKPWCMPDGITAQYAGGFGMASAGVLYNFNNKYEIDLTVGYVPPAYGKIWTANILFAHTILPVQLNESFILHLFKAGAFLNYNRGKNIYLKWPEHYGKDYYWWNSSLRFGPFVNTELQYKPERGLSYTVFFQCLTNDIYLYTYLPNTRSLGFDDILYYGAGIKIQAAGY